MAFSKLLSILAKTQNNKTDTQLSPLFTISHPLLHLIFLQWLICSVFAFQKYGTDLKAF